MNFTLPIQLTFSSVLPHHSTTAQFTLTLFSITTCLSLNFPNPSSAVRSLYHFLLIIYVNSPLMLAYLLSTKRSPYSIPFHFRFISYSHFLLLPIVLQFLQLYFLNLSAIPLNSSHFSLLLRLVLRILLSLTIIPRESFPFSFRLIFSHPCQPFLLAMYSVQFLKYLFVHSNLQ